MSRRAGPVARLLIGLAAAAGAAAAQAQDVPQIISPLRVEPDRNDVNLVDGRTSIDLPVLAVPAAPNLRFDRIQNAAPYVSGRVTGGAPDQPNTRTYSVHTGTGTSDSFQCVDFDCASIAGTGSTFRWNANVYRQAGSAAVWTFNLRHVVTAGPQQSLLYYASSVAYPNGETISYSYQTAALAGDPFPGRLFYRPTRIASNLGYEISIAYQGNDFNGDPNAWGTPATVTLFASAAPTAPLGRLTYSGDTITDLGGRVHACRGCNNQLGLDIEVAAGWTWLPGETAPATQVVALPGNIVVGSVARDGVAWTYAYDNLHLEGTAWLYSRLTVNGPNDYRQVYDVAAAGPAASRRNVIVRATDSIGRATAYSYDEYYRPVRIVRPEGNAVEIGYDEYGNIDWRRARAKPGTGLPDILETAAFPTDSCAGAGTPILCYRPTSSRDALGRQTDYAYNARGQLTEQLDPADATGVRRRTSIGYETGTGLSRRSAVRICADTGASCGTNAPIQTEYDYWGTTFLPLAERRIGLEYGATATLTTTFGYDSAGRLISTDGPLPGSDDALYNRYDVWGRRTWEIGARGPNGLRIARRFTWRGGDDKPLATETGTVADPASTTLAVLSRTDLVYDGRRNPVRETVSAAGATYGVLDRSFDDSGRLECETRRMNPAAFPVNGAGGSLPASACTLGPQGFGANDFGRDRIARNIYDAAGQRLQRRVAVATADEAAEASWTYTPNGQVETIVDGNGNRAELHYDGHGRQDRWTFPSPTAAGATNPLDYEAYSYDAAGNRTSLRRRDGTTIAYTYDDLDRLTVKAVPASAGGAAGYSVHYGYDLGDAQLYARFGSPAGSGVTNSYDGFGRLQSSATDMDGTQRTLYRGYDAAGDRTRIVHPDGAWFDYTYDALGRLRGIFENGGGQIISHGYAPGGERTGIGRGGSGTTFGYDAVGRLTSLTQNIAGAGNVGWTFARTPAGQVASEARDNDAYAWTGHYAVTRAYTANGLNQYRDAGPTHFAYDLNGNLISDGANAFRYDGENRLVAVSGAHNATLAYDPLGRLWQVTGPAGTTRFLYEGDALIAEYGTDGAVQRRYVHGAGTDEPLIGYQPGAVSSANRFQLNADRLGSIVAITSATGASTATNRYDEYGMPAATNTGRFGYTGQMWLPELGLYYYKARMYSPGLGRFMQTDPVGYAGGINLYAYVGDDPVNMADPSGSYKCVGSNADCGKIDGYVGQVRSAARAAEQRTGTRLVSSTARALNSIVAFLGQRNQDNGVTITSADLPDGVLGDHGPGPNRSTDIQLDLPNLERSRGSTGAGTLAHETTHGVQERAAGQPADLDEIFHREFVANAMESFTNEYLSQETSVWSSQMSPPQRRANIRHAAWMSCEYARRYYMGRYRGQACPR